MEEKFEHIVNHQVTNEPYSREIIKSIVDEFVSEFDGDYPKFWDNVEHKAGTWIRKNNHIHSIKIILQARADFIEEMISRNDQLREKVNARRH